MFKAWNEYYQQTIRQLVLASTSCVDHRGLLELEGFVSEVLPQTRVNLLITALDHPRNVKMLTAEIARRYEVLQIQQASPTERTVQALIHWLVRKGVVVSLGDHQQSYSIRPQYQILVQLFYKTIRERVSCALREALYDGSTNLIAQTMAQLDEYTSTQQLHLSGWLDALALLHKISPAELYLQRVHHVRAALILLLETQPKIVRRVMFNDLVFDWQQQASGLAVGIAKLLPEVQALYPERDLFVVVQKIPLDAFSAEIALATDIISQQAYIPISQYGGAAAINGGFFVYGEADQTPYDVFGTPIGLVMKKGNVEYPPIYNRAALLINTTGQIFIDTVGLQQLTVECSPSITVGGDYVNTLDAPQDVPIFFSRVFNKKLAGAFFKQRIQIVIVGTTVCAQIQGDTEIPFSGFVISLPEGHPAIEFLQAGATADYAIRFPQSYGIICEALAAGPQLLHHRHSYSTDELVQEFEREDILDSAAPLRFYSINFFQEDFDPRVAPLTFSRDREIHEKVYPRSAIGITADKQVLLLSAIGDFDNPLNMGLSFIETADILSAMGCVEALNLDGGMSVCQHNGERGLLTTRKIEFFENIEREIPNAICFVLKKE